ncbi:hypothetical protein U1Q18_010279, partial [Sarracenia purpurea var. burkii]
GAPLACSSAGHEERGRDAGEESGSHHYQSSSHHRLTNPATATGAGHRPTILGLISEFLPPIK